tara:strand:- start:1179 stop:1445 length:267 start_codon:yes stop_codon:yes gene_type:complete
VNKGLLSIHQLSNQPERKIMLVIQSIASGEPVYICSLDFKEINEKISNGLKMSISMDGTQYNAEPSAIRELKKECEYHGHFCSLVTFK